MSFVLNVLCVKTHCFIFSQINSLEVRSWWREILSTTICPLCLIVTREEHFFISWLDSPSGRRPPLWKFCVHTQWDTAQSVGLHWTSDRPDTETYTWQQTKLTRDREAWTPAVFEPGIAASERTQTHALERAASGTGNRENQQSAMQNLFPNWVLTPIFTKDSNFCL